MRKRSSEIGAKFVALAFDMFVRGVKDIWDFKKAQIIELYIDLGPGSDNDLRVSIEAGITIQYANGWLLAGEAHYDGIDDDCPEAYGGSLKLTVSFN